MKTSTLFYFGGAALLIYLLVKRSQTAAQSATSTDPNAALTSGLVNSLTSAVTAERPYLSTSASSITSDLLASHPYLN